MQQATLVEYATAPDSVGGEILFTWTVSPTGEVQFYQKPLVDTSFKTLVEQSRESLGGRLRGGLVNAEPQPETQRESLRALHQLLVYPIQISDRVIFIPQDDLFLVPFSALLDEEEQPLVRKTHYLYLTLNSAFEPGTTAAIAD